MSESNFRIDIHQLVDVTSGEPQQVWWLTVSGAGKLTVKTFGKSFTTEEEAVDYARAYIAGYREPKPQERGT